MSRVRSFAVSIILVASMGGLTAACQSAAPAPKAKAPPSEIRAGDGQDNVAPKTENPFIGVWKFDPVRSRLVAETIRYEDIGGGRMRFSNAGASSYEFAIDGKDHRTVGSRAVSWKVVGPKQWEAVVKLDGKITETARVTLSRDGNPSTSSRMASCRTECPISIRSAMRAKTLATAWPERGATS